MYYQSIINDYLICNLLNVPQFPSLAKLFVSEEEKTPSKFRTYKICQFFARFFFILPNFSIKRAQWEIVYFANLILAKFAID